MNDSENIKVKRNLTALVEFSRIINSSLDLEFILNNVLLTCMGKFLATKGLIALNMEGTLVPKSFKGLSNEYLAAFPELEPNENLLKDDKLRGYLDEGKLVAVQRISSSDSCLGIVCLGEKLNRTPFTEDDLEFLGTILNISASAIQNSLMINELKKVNRELDSRIQRLNSLFELSKEFGLLADSAKVAKLLVYSVIGQFLVSKFAVISFEDGGTRILESKFSNDDIITSIKSYDFLSLENPLTKNEIENNYPLMSELHVELIVPMNIQNKTKGLVLLGKRINNQPYSSTDIEFIYSVGSLAIISLENRRLFKEELAKQKMEEELDIARGIQKNLLPSSIPSYDKFDLAVMNLSSQQVGGDYYDIIRLSDDSFCIAIADVSGKGVPAALLMANLQAFLKTTCKQGMHLEEATALINDLISENTSDGKFITFFWGVIDTSRNTIHYVNAGHNPPLLVRKGKIKKLTQGGIILGVMKTIMPYTSELIELEKDDALILFTDGITEAKNKNDDEFSDENLEELALRVYEKSADDILGSIKSEVQAFASGTTQSDDMTMVVVKVK